MAIETIGLEEIVVLLGKAHFPLLGPQGCTKAQLNDNWKPELLHFRT